MVEPVIMLGVNIVVAGQEESTRGERTATQLKTVAGLWGLIEGGRLLI